MSKNLRNIGIVSGATMVSRVLGLGRDMAITAVFGTSALASAFVTAFTLPNLFRRLLGEGALTAALVPTLNEELAERERAGAFALVNQVASWLMIVTGSIVAVGMAVLQWVAYRAAAAESVGGPWARWQLGAELAVILFPYLVFVCMAAALSAALQTLHRFLEPALSPIWLNLAMIGALGGAVWLGWADAEDARMHWLCGGVLLGGALQMLVPAWALTREGWRPKFDLRVSVRSIARLMGPTVLGSAIYLVNMSVSRVIGLSLNESAAAILNLASRLMELPIGVFAVAVSTVLFPLISRKAAEGDWEGMTEAYRKGLRLILVINMPAAVGLVVLAQPMVRLLFQRGAFGADDTASLVPVLAVFAVGLPFFSFVNVVLRAFYAQKDTKTPVKAAGWSFAINIGLSFALMKPLGTLGLALATNVAVVVQAIYLQWRLTRGRASLAFAPVWRDVGKVVFAAILMGVVVGGGLWLSRRFAPPDAWADGLRLAVLVPVGMIVYAALVWSLRVEGRQDLAGILRRRFRGKR